MEKVKSSLPQLREIRPIAWFLPLHLELDAPTSLSECLQRMNSQFNVKGKDSFQYEAVTSTEASFKISRLYERTSLACTGTLRQISESQTRLYAKFGNEDPLMLGVGAIVLTLLGIVIQAPFIIFLNWGAVLYLARRNYQTQRELADDLETVFLKRWK